MITPWIPKNFDEAARRNAGRRKLHRRKRKARADRIARLLATMAATSSSELLETSYGWVSALSLAMQVSKATASRDLSLVRRINRQFGRLFGRPLDPNRDRVVWTWNIDFYGFITPESKRAGYPKPVGHFPFSVRQRESEESYQGFNQLSWQNSNFISQMSTRDLMRSLSWSVNRLARIRR